MRVGMTYDLRDDYLALGYDAETTAEFDKGETIDAIEGVLRGLGHEVVRIGRLEALLHRLVAGERWDLVFNIAEGLYGLGRESQVPAVLDAYRIPYTFSDPLVLALTLHKGMAKRVVRDAGVPTPDFAVIDDVADLAQLSLPYPLFAKPVAEGTSKGIYATSRVSHPAELRVLCEQLLSRFAQPVLIETYLPGREFTVGILGSGAAGRTLGVMEVLLNGNAEQGAYSYENKELYETRVDYRLEQGALAQAVSGVALAAWRALGCLDAGRVDVRLDAEGSPSFIEVNPLAGLNPIRSDLAVMARLAGVGYAEVLEEVVTSACLRAGLPPRGRVRQAMVTEQTAPLFPA